MKRDRALSIIWIFALIIMAFVLGFVLVDVSEQWSCDKKKQVKTYTVYEWSQEKSK
jgi:hypothetical protein